MTLPEVSQTILLSPLFELLKFLYVSTGNFGLAIIAFTVLIRLLLFPLSVPTLKSQKKMREIQPELAKLKKQYGDDNKKMQMAQLELYKKHNINPLSGCLPYLLQFVVIIALYSVLQSFVQKAGGMGIAVNTRFFWLDLSKPDMLRVIPILAGVTQLALSLMILPGKERHDLIPDTAKTKKLKEANKQEAKTQDMAEAMQQQMVFLMPVMTGVLALNFPSGLGLYWVATTVFSIVQQWIISGPGGLVSIPTSWIARLTNKEKTV